jgi:hypothetical protein
MEETTRLVKQAMLGPLTLFPVMRFDNDDLIDDVMRGRRTSEPIHEY